MLDVMSLKAVDRDKQYAQRPRGLQIGAAATLLLIAASMLVSMLEQLRERKRLLAALTAFGTRRPRWAGRSCGRPRSRSPSAWPGRSVAGSAWARS